MTGYGSDKTAYEMETEYCDFGFDRAERKYRQKNISEDVGEW